MFGETYRLNKDFLPVITCRKTARHYAEAIQKINLLKQCKIYNLPSHNTLSVFTIFCMGVDSKLEES